MTGEDKTTGAPATSDEPAIGAVCIMTTEADMAGLLNGGSRGAATGAS
eukprot:CAMPEP_0168430832 /NCGR_PEP_ID=MMETSP0228-20121227/38076_1 /TAXON_ID=133427 /ORGANISM="Protoceratium reticulatum, Strain CCCM 535 (=CCMP 1889)" /LENGTH=47 /DNA_ID= /DNA_START= /DNA_END= /DNA_ORIENTATION=